MSENPIKSSRTNSLDNHTSDNTSNIGKKTELYEQDFKSIKYDENGDIDYKSLFTSLVLQNCNDDSIARSLCI